MGGADHGVDNGKLEKEVPGKIGSGGALGGLSRRHVPKQFNNKTRTSQKNESVQAKECAKTTVLCTPAELLKKKRKDEYNGF